jgi:hypothetical protein
MNNKNLQTVVETFEFVKQAKSCMEKQAKDEFIDFIAKNPFAGDLIPGTGGARKIRWQKNIHDGKRGGVRIIYYYYDQTLPIFLFTVYAKNDRSNLTMNEKAILQNIIKSIVESYRG